VRDDWRECSGERCERRSRRSSCSGPTQIVKSSMRCVKSSMRSVLRSITIEKSRERFVPQAITIAKSSMRSVPRPIPIVKSRVRLDLLVDQIVKSSMQMVPRAMAIEKSAEQNDLRPYKKFCREQKCADDFIGRSDQRTARVDRVSGSPRTRIALQNRRIECISRRCT